MKPRQTSNLVAAAATLFSITVLTTVGVAQTGVSYLDPTGGWLYTYDGAFLPSVADPNCVGGMCPPGFGGTPQDGQPVLALDGTYLHDQGDKWDGTAPGDPLSDPNAPVDPGNHLTGNQGTSPGGAGRFIDTDGRDYIRIQDAGNPEEHGWVQDNQAFPGQPGRQINTNRRVYFGHDLAQDGITGEDQLFLDNGFTLSFRARIPNSGPLDDIYTLDENTDPVVLPWLPSEDPDRLRGFPVHNEGRGMITIVQNQVFDDFGDLVNKDFPIAFSLISAADIADIGTGVYASGSGKGGLVMNNLNGNSPNSNISFEHGGSLNLLEIDEEELDDWHEFWITIEDNGGAAGTHKVRIYMDGEVDANGDPVFTDFNVTASTPGNSSYANANSAFLELGVNDNGMFGAFDMDFISLQLGVHAPVVAVLFDDADFNEDGSVDGDDFLLWQNGFGIPSGAEKMDGDADNDGDVDGNDFLLWQSQFGGGGGASAAVPEPAATALLCCLVVPLAFRRCRSAS